MGGYIYADLLSITVKADALFISMSPRGTLCGWAKLISIHGALCGWVYDTEMRSYHTALTVNSFQWLAPYYANRERYSGECVLLNE